MSSTVVPGLSTSQVTALVVTERVNSAISIAGILFILATFAFSPYFNKPINRLIFFASFGNIGSNIAALISDAGPIAGQSSATCQVQAFLVQMFLGVDCLWAFCMAINVYLAFFGGYSVKQFRSLDVKYLLFCYGVSFIPAFVFIFINSGSRGRMYGEAIIWCWIDVKWDFMRVIFLYAWIWIGAVFAFAVYVKAGIVIYRKRNQLRGFLNPLNENPFMGTVTTEIQVTSEAAAPVASDNESIPFTELTEPSAYTANVESDKRNASLPALFNVRTLTREAAEESVNPDAWLYARVAFLFFLALLITWVPSSINRVYALVYPSRVNFGLNYASSFVFPLQGFWNTIVYIITSQTACQKLWRDLFVRDPRQGGRNPTKPPNKRDSFGERLKGSPGRERLHSQDTILAR